MERWEHFLNSLSTRGGNIFVLSLFVVVFLAVVSWAFASGRSGEFITVIVGAFSAFYGALLQALVGSGSRQRQADANGNGVDKKPQ